MQSQVHEIDDYSQRVKIAIPRRFHQPKATTKAVEDRGKRACKLCQLRSGYYRTSTRDAQTYIVQETRCSGALPSCQNCSTAKIACVYERSRRDRLNIAIELNHRLASLLWDLSGHLDGEFRQKIRDVVKTVEDDMLLQATKLPLITLGKRDHSALEDDKETTENNEAHVGGWTGPDQGLDNLVEPSTRNPISIETGYIGQASEVQWLRSVQRQMQHMEAEPRALTDELHGSGQHAMKGSLKHATDTSFYVNSSDPALDGFIDPFEIPDLETAEQLFDCYITTVHPSFPLVAANFDDQFRRYVESVRRHRAFVVSDRWRAQLNLVFAIGAKYSHLVGAKWRGDEHDHLVYMMRATHLISLDSPVRAFSTPDLELVQATSSLSFYFLITGHVSRAWTMIGVSLRHATGLGLHLRNEDPAADRFKRDVLTNIWWVACSIECLLNIITGRPPVISDEYSTVSLPDNSINEYHRAESTLRYADSKITDHPSAQPPSSSSNPGSDKDSLTTRPYFTSRVEISIITRKAHRWLYSPRTATRPWLFVQRRISDLLDDLKKWGETALLADPEAEHVDTEQASHDEQFVLKTDYWSTKILLTQPCLRRQAQRIHNHSGASAEFDTKAAEVCVTAALEMVKLFPAQPDAEFIYTKGPWWAIVHIIMQSMAILLLEMAYSGQGRKEENESVLPSIKKLLRWLRALQDNDPVAARAHDVVGEILKSSAPVLQTRVAELLASDCIDIPQVQTPCQSQMLHATQPLDGSQEKDLSSGLTADSITLDPASFDQWLFDPFPSYQSHTLRYFPEFPQPNYVYPENFVHGSLDQGLLFVDM